MKAGCIVTNWFQVLLLLFLCFILFSFVSSGDFRTDFIFFSSFKTILKVLWPYETILRNTRAFFLNKIYEYANDVFNGIFWKTRYFSCPKGRCVLLTLQCSFFFESCWNNTQYLNYCMDQSRDQHQLKNSWFQRTN